VKACLLAAGCGLRLGMKDGPKTLIELDGKPLLYYILDSLNILPLASRIIVGGYAFDELKKSVDAYGDENNLIVLNEKFIEGSLLTVFAARHFLMGDDFILLNGDHLFSQTIMNCVHEFVRNNRLKNITLLCDHDRSLEDDDMKVELKNGLFTRMAKQLTNYDYGYIGSSIIPQSRQNVYWACVEKLINAGQTQLNVEQIINELALEGEPIDILDASGSHWIEIDTPEDLIKAKVKIRSVVPTHL